MTSALDSLADQADKLAAPSDTTPGAVAPPPPPPESPNLGAIGFFLTAFRELSCRILDAESPETTLSDEKIEQCAAVLAPVADKYGLNLGGWLSGPEGAAIAVAGPILWEAARQLNAELKAKRKKAAAEPKGEGGPIPEGS